MAKIRIKKSKKYVVMSDHHLREKEMTLKAKGLLSLMLSLPDEWEYSSCGLATLSKDGRDGTREALKELERFGYLTRTLSHGENGKLNGYTYTVYERPQSVNKETAPLTDLPLTDLPLTANPTQYYIGNNLDKSKLYNNIYYNKNNNNLYGLSYSACASARKENNAPEMVEPPCFFEIAQYFKNELCVDDPTKEAELFDAYNEFNGWACLPNWKAAAKRWACRIEEFDAK